jgi:undecaprenyl-diphosphatase
MTIAEATVERVAQALAHAALPGFYVTLVVLMIAVAIGGRWWLAHSHVVEAARDTSLRTLLARMAIGFAIIVVAAWVFAAIADEIGEGETLGRLDTLVSSAIGQPCRPRRCRPSRLSRTSAIRRRSARCASSWRWCSSHADERALALGWVIAITGNAVLNTTLKGVFERVRPVHDQAIAHADGYSFPSGHTSGSVVAYGMLAYVLIRTTPPAFHLPALVAGAAIAFVTGCSRVFLQVHYPSDVVAGFASGLAWLGIVIASVEAARQYRKSRRAR